MPRSCRLSLDSLVTTTSSLATCCMLKVSMMERSEADFMHVCMSSGPYHSSSMSVSVSVGVSLSVTIRDDDDDDDDDDNDPLGTTANSATPTERLRSSASSTEISRFRYRPSEMRSYPGERRCEKEAEQRVSHHKPHTPSLPRWCTFRTRPAINLASHYISIHITLPRHAINKPCSSTMGMALRLCWIIRSKTWMREVSGKTVTSCGPYVPMTTSFSVWTAGSWFRYWDR